MLMDGGMGCVSGCAYLQLYSVKGRATNKGVE